MKRPFLECMKKKISALAQEREEDLEERAAARRVLRPEEEPFDRADLGFDEIDELNARERKTFRSSSCRKRA